MDFLPWPAIKGQALADFIAEFTTLGEKRPDETPIAPTIELPTWKLFVDGSSNESGFGAGLILISLEEHRVHCALRLGFKASNNEAEYEALIAGLRLAKEMRAESLDIYIDSQLVVCQITNEYQVRGENMAPTLRKPKTC